MLGVRVCDGVVTPCDLRSLETARTLIDSLLFAVSGLSSGVVMVAAGGVRARVFCFAFVHAWDGFGARVFVLYAVVRVSVHLRY